jgi:hypothetical protein
VYSCRVAFPREDHHRLGLNPKQIVVAAMLPPIPWQQCCEVIVLVIGGGHRFPLKAVAVIAPAERTNTKRGEAVSFPCHRRPPVFADLAASHHHTIGKADAPYSGSLSGWENRSQRDARTLS